MIKATLQGKPLGHPLHPLLVHFPVGLWVLSLLLDLASLAAGSHAVVRAAFYTMLLGEITALLAAVPGLVDWLDIRADHPAKQNARDDLFNTGFLIKDLPSHLRSPCIQ